MNENSIHSARCARIKSILLLGLAVAGASALYSAHAQAQATQFDCLMTIAAGVPIGPIAVETGTGYALETCITTDGRNGTPLCGDPPQPSYSQPYDYPGTCAPSEALITSGDVSPKYMILGVAYAPPGSLTCGDSKSFITYDDDSSVETTIDTAQSFKDSEKVSVELDAKVGMFAMGSAGASMGQEDSGSNSNAMTVKTSLSTTSKISGSCNYDGINHDDDRILVLLAPVVAVRVSDPVGCPTCSADLDNTTWGIQPSGVTFDVFAGELKGTMPMRQSTSDTIAAHSLTQDDLAQMLSADPLAYWSGDETADPDLGRFVRAFGVGTLPYTTPIPGGSMPSITKVMNGSVSTKDAQARSFDTTVTLDAGIDASFLMFLTLKLKTEASWTWTNSNDSALTDAASEGATVTIGSPSAAYRGPSSIAVYYDTLFKTYAFVGKI